MIVPNLIFLLLRDLFVMRHYASIDALAFILSFLALRELIKNKSAPLFRSRFPKV